MTQVYHGYIERLGERSIVPKSAAGTAAIHMQPGETFKEAAKRTMPEMQAKVEAEFLAMAGLPRHAQPDAAECE